MDKTCKSNGFGLAAMSGRVSGARVRNTWATCPEVGDSPPKGGLIPNVATGRWSGTLKVAAKLPLLDGPEAYQLVGEVTAHQGDDG